VVLVAHNGNTFDFKCLAHSLVKLDCHHHHCCQQQQQQHIPVGHCVQPEDDLENSLLSNAALAAALKEVQGWLALDTLHLLRGLKAVQHTSLVDLEARSGRLRAAVAAAYLKASWLGVGVGLAVAGQALLLVLHASSLCLRAQEICTAQSGSCVGCSTVSLSSSWYCQLYCQLYCLLPVLHSTFCNCICVGGCTTQFFCLHGGNAL